MISTQNRIEKRCLYLVRWKKLETHNEKNPSGSSVGDHMSFPTIVFRVFFAGREKIYATWKPHFEESIIHERRYDVVRLILNILGPVLFIGR